MDAIYTVIWIGFWFAAGVLFTLVVYWLSSRPKWPEALGDGYFKDREKEGLRAINDKLRGEVECLKSMLETERILSLHLEEKHQELRQMLKYSGNCCCRERCLINQSKG